MLNRITIACAAMAFVATTCVVADAAAQTGAYPSKPIRLIVPFAAGGSSDLLGRILAEKVGADLGQQMIVDNRAGGNAVLGTQVVASSRPDGYTLLLVTPTVVVIGSLQKNLPYDVERDLTPVIGVGAVPLLLTVSSKSNIRSVADLVAMAKSTSGGITYASGGVGSLGHLAPARFVRELKMTASHVPYRGVAPAIQDVVANRVQFMFISSVEGVQVARSGGIRLIGVTSEQRLSEFPDAPTMAELGFGDFTPAVWYGFLVRANTPGQIVDRLYQAFAKVINDPGIQARLSDLGVTVRVRNGAEFGKFMRDESVRWRRVISENNITME